MLSIRLKGGEAQARAVLATVAVFKRTTSLGGGESLIEHRRSAEGPSSPVPDDLLRLSVGLEAPADLIADLEAALDAAAREQPVSAPTPPLDSETTPARVDDLAASVTAILERSAAPLVIARGGEIRLVDACDGVVTIEACGSPGALRPVIGQIEALLRAALPHVTAVRFTCPEVARDRDQRGRQPAGMFSDDLGQISVRPAHCHSTGRISTVEQAGQVLTVRSASSRSATSIST